MSLVIRWKEGLRKKIFFSFFYEEKIFFILLFYQWIKRLRTCSCFLSFFIFLNCHLFISQSCLEFIPPIMLRLQFSKKSSIIKLTFFLIATAFNLLLLYRFFFLFAPKRISDILNRHYYFQQTIFNENPLLFLFLCGNEVTFSHLTLQNVKSRHLSRVSTYRLFE